MVSVNHPQPKRKLRSPNSRYYRTQALQLDVEGMSLDEYREITKNCETWLDILNAKEAEISRREAEQEKLDRDCVRYSGAW